MRIIARDLRWARWRLQAVALPDWAIIVGIASLLRFVNLGAESLWYDEAFTAWLARLPFPQMWEALKGDVHPALWYIVEWLTVRIFGNTEFYLRLPAALCSVLACWLIWRIALALGLSRSTALAAGLLAAVLPGAVYYAQDARMYPLLSVFVLVMALGAIKDKWGWFALGGVGAVYTQNLGWFYVVAMGIAVMISRMKTPRQLLEPGIAGMAIVLLWLPWLPIFLAQAQTVGLGFWMQPLSAGGVLLPFMTITMGWRVAEPFQIHVYGAALALTAFGLIKARRWLYAPKGLILFGTGIGVPALLALVSILWRSIYLPRVMLPAMLVLVIAWADLLMNASLPNRRLARLIAIPALLITLTAHYFPAQAGRENFGAYLALVRHDWRPGDTLYFIAADAAVLTRYYSQDLPYAIMPEASDLNQSLTGPTKEAMMFVQAHFDDLRAKGFKRAWLILSINPLTSAVELAELDRIIEYWRSERVYGSGDLFYSTYIYRVIL